MHRLNKKINRTSVLKRVEEVAEIELRQEIHEVQLEINEVESQIANLQTDRESLSEFLTGRTREGSLFDPHFYMNTQKKIAEFDEQLTQSFDILAEFEKKSDKLHDHLKMTVSRTKSLHRLGVNFTNSKQRLLNDEQNKFFDDMAVLKHCKGD